jgi:ribonuclease BN (tRNA processing enzyme)
MHLTVLGGAGACPNPGQGSSSYIVQHQDSTLLVDCGPNTILELRKHVHLGEITAVVLSHVHSDHTLDLVPLRYGLKYAPQMPKQQLPLWVPPQGQEFLDGVARAFAVGDESVDTFFNDVFNVEEYDPDDSLEVGPFRLTFHDTRHFIPCWAMRIEAGGKSIAYLADTGPYPQLSNFARDADLVICEASMGPEKVNGPESTEGHLNARQAGELAAMSGAKQMLLTHLWVEFGIIASAQEAAEAFGQDVIIANPGTIIEI